MGSEQLKFPTNAAQILSDHGETWMRRTGVRGVGLESRNGRMVFVILIDDPSVAAEIPAVIGGYPTQVDSGKLRAAAARR